MHEHEKKNHSLLDQMMRKLVSHGYFKKLKIIKSLVMTIGQRKIQKLVKSIAGSFTY
jgi:hypothetical protein